MLLYVYYLDSEQTFGYIYLYFVLHALLLLPMFESTGHLAKQKV